MQVSRIEDLKYQGTECRGDVRILHAAVEPGLELVLVIRAHRVNPERENSMRWSTKSIALTWT